MAGISNYLADFVNDWMHGNAVTFSPPATTYFALMTTMPTSSGGGAEVTGGSYVRLAVTNNATNWPASSGGVKRNGTPMTWVTPTADWGNILGVAEYDASTGGNLLMFAAFASAQSILSGQVFSLPILAGAFSWVGGISTYLANKLNDWLHGGGTYVVPTTTYFSLMTVMPLTIANDGADVAGTETSGGSYARVGFTNNATDWPASIAQSKVNAVALAWGAASGNWTGPEIGIAEFDAASAGNMLSFGLLTTAVTVNSGAAPNIPTSAAVYQTQ